MDEVEKLGNLEYAKDLWTLLAQTKFEVSCVVLENELITVRNQLLRGILCFEPPNEESEVKLRNKTFPRIYEFTVGLKKLLGIDAIQAYDLLVDYLLYEFRGSEVGLEACLVSDSKLILLMADIWEFYRSERLFILKCVNLVLCSSDEDNVKQKVMAEFIDSFGRDQFLDNLILQLEALLKEEYPTRDLNGHLMTPKLQKMWRTSNLREQIEILHNLILYADRREVSPSHFKKILQICIDDYFGKKEITRAFGGFLHMEYITLIGYLQNVLLLRCLNLAIVETALAWTQCVDYAHLDQTIGLLGDEPEHAPIALIWTLLKVLTVSGSNIPDISEKFGEQALNLGAFEYLRKILECELMQDYTTRLSKITFRVIYDFMCLFIKNFNRPDLHELRGLINLAGPLFRHPDNIEDVWHDVECTGPRLLLVMLSERFPVDGIPFVEAAEGLAAGNTDHMEELNQLMMKMEYFAERWDPDFRFSCFTIGSTATSSGILEVRYDRKPRPGYDFVIQMGTKGYFLDRDSLLCTWKCNFNILTGILFELQNFVGQLSLEFGDPESAVSRAVPCLKFLKTWFTLPGRTKCDVECELINLIYQQLIELLKNRDNAPTTLFALCLDISQTILKSYPWRVINGLKIWKTLPTLRSVPANVALIFDNEYFFSNTIGDIVSYREVAVGRYPLLIAYLNYIYELIKDGSTVEEGVRKHFEFILPGVVYVLGEVFPCYHTWHFVDENDHDVVSVTCVEIINRILTMTYEKNMNPEMTPPLLLLQKIVLYSLLNLEAGKELLKIVASGESVIQIKMEKQLHWLSKEETSMVRIVRLALSILNRVLLLKSLVQDEKKLSSLDMLIYTAPNKEDSLRVIPTVASYMNNNFCRYLPVMAVTVLRTFAKYLPRTLLACLGMEPDVIRDMVFRKLNSNLETDLLKESLIQLISACVDTQPGMCEALFNIHYSETRLKRREIVKNNVRGGCLVYVCLQLLKAEEDITSRLYAAAVDCVCSIWIGDAEAVVDYLRNREGFWKAFCAPVLKNPSTYVYAHTQIFTIITLELFDRRNKIHPDLLNIFEKFFDAEDGVITDWIKCLAAMFENNDPQKPMVLHSSQPLEKLPQKIQFLVTMKRFLVISMRFLPFKISTAQIVVIATYLLKSMQEAWTSMNSQALLMLADLFLLIIQSLGMNFFDDTKMLKNQILTMLHTISNVYEMNTSLRLRESVLAVILKAVDCLSEELKEDPVGAEVMLQSTCNIVIIELMELKEAEKKTLEKFFEELKQPEVKREVTFPKASTCRLTLCLLHKLLTISDEYVVWFKEFQLSTIPVLLVGAFGDILRINQNVWMDPVHLDVAVHLIHILLLFVRHEVTTNSFISHLQNHMWLQLTPPQYSNPVTWLKTHWIDVYKPSLELLTAFLSTHGWPVVESSVTFVGMHTECLVTAIVGLRHTLKPNVLKLSITTLNFIRVLLEYRKIWSLYHGTSYDRIVEAVMSCLYTATALLANPTMLKIFLDRCDEKAEAAETDASLQATANLVLQLAYTCLAVFQSFTPRLMSLTSENGAFVAAEWKPILELSYNGPVLEADLEMPFLSFGTLITLASLCTQSLSKGIRIPSPGVYARNVRTGPGLGSSVVFVMNKHFTKSVLEMTMEMITSQGLLHLLGNQLSYNKKEIFRRTLNTELTFLWVYVARITRQKKTSTDYAHPWNSYLATVSKRYVSSSSPSKSDTSLEMSKVSLVNRQNVDKLPSKMPPIAEDNVKQVQTNIGPVESPSLMSIGTCSAKSAKQVQPNTCPVETPPLMLTGTCSVRSTKQVQPSISPLKSISLMSIDTCLEKSTKQAQSNLASAKLLSQVSVGSCGSSTSHLGQERDLHDLQDEETQVYIQFLAYVFNKFIVMKSYPRL